MDLDDFTPAGAGSLRDPYGTRPLIHNGQTVATFSTPELNLDARYRQVHLRSALRPGHGFEHEPLDSAEKTSQHTAQNAAAFDHAEASRMIRSALRPGS
jgi:hypothetical protein